jgi:hypothetical protein
MNSVKICCESVNRSRERRTTYSTELRIYETTCIIVRLLIIINVFKNVITVAVVALIRHQYFTIVVSRTIWVVARGTVIAEILPSVTIASPWKSPITTTAAACSFMEIAIVKAWAVRHAWVVVNLIITSQAKDELAYSH